MHQYAAIDDTVYFWFSANDTSGSGDDGASALFDVREAGSASGAAPLLSGSPSLLSHASYPAGCYEVAVAATTGNGFAASDTFAVFCTLAVDSQNPTGFVGSCTLTPLATSAEITALDTVAGRIETDTQDLQTQIGTAGAGLTDLGGMSTAMRAEVNSEADTALSDYDGPTNAEMEARTLPSASYGTAANQTTIAGYIDTEIAAIKSVVDAIKLITDALPDSGALSSLAQGSDLATVDALIDAIKVVTDALGSSAAANLALSAAGIVGGAVNDGSATTTAFVADGFTEATDDHFNGRIVVFTSGALSGQASDITDYTGATQTITVTALTEAPADNVTFVIV